jgi:DNA-directed RNA polymerase subunit alpha
LEPGYGLTVGNALRRVLLSSLEGFAFTSIKIENVEHEFTSLPGIVEDVTEIILNLKQIRLKRQIDSVDNETVSVSINSQSQIKAADLQKFISGFQILNPDLVICNMEKNVKLNFELNIDIGSRIIITLECTQCRTNENQRTNGVSRYTTMKNRKNSSTRLEIKKHRVLWSFLLP